MEQQVDAVVNAANRYLAAGGGICGAIFAKAGNAQLQQACERYPTPLSDGDAVITPAFGITNAKAIIHAVGPDFRVARREPNQNRFISLFFTNTALKCLAIRQYSLTILPCLSKKTGRYKLQAPLG